MVSLSTSNDSEAPRPLAGRKLRLRLNAGKRLRPFVVRRQMQWVLDGLLGSLSMLLAYQLRFDMGVPASFRSQMWTWVAAMVVLEPVAMSLGGGYRSTWKHFGARDVGRMTLRQGAVLAVLLAGVVPHGLHWIPVGVALIQALVALSLLGSMRMLRRLDHEAVVRSVASERVLLVSTASTASSAVRQLLPVYGAAIAGLVIDEEGWHKLRINGVPVLGGMDQLGMLIAQENVTLLLLCSAELPHMNDIMQTAADMGAAVKLLPSVHDVVGNNVRVSRTVTPAAIRQTAGVTGQELHEEVVACLSGRTVLLTGAAGSIGSELVRQVKSTPAARLLLLDQDENGMFELLHQIGPDARVVPIIADIRDAEAIRSVFQRERPHVVLHAAAYKHVPLMEQNPCEAVLNNVIGTRTLAEAAIEFEAERFVMISSDKAVNPSSVMGASKRLAEMVIQDLSTRAQQQGCTVRFACVRFGNVLGSRGSVLPLFLKQIEQGGPLTVTHEQMTRYFMTIPQAVSLVLRAATLASRGDIYMLDMGDPVLIVQFARELIQLSGLTPDKDIEIRIVGSRPGEKLHEELWSEDAEVSRTTFKHIFQVKQEDVDPSFAHLLVQLEHEAREHQADAVLATMRNLSISYLTEQSRALEPLTTA